MLSTPHPDWSDRVLGLRLRPWQAHAVDAVTARLAEPGARACLVAPPGAGKTICALAIASELGCPVEVRVPTTVLREQWEARIADALVAVADGAPPPPIQVKTYASGAPLAAGALVMLDEAHHVTQAWGRSIEAGLGPHHRVLGLTATPPHGAAGWDRFVGLVGTEPIEIATPPLVREGQLCPYQDLVWPVQAELDDLPALQAIDQALRDLEAAQAGPFLRWETLRLTEDLWSLTEERFAGGSSLLVALCRLRIARGADLPADLPADPELLAPPTLHDRAMALWSSAPDDPGLASGLRAAGFRLRAGGPVLQDDIAWRGLAGSGARIRGTLDLLAAEHAARGDHLRALVVCDRDVEGDRLAARQVLRRLVTDPRTDALDPILVTGSVFWVDDDLWPRLAGRLPDLPWTPVDGHHELDTTGWKTSERVALATRLLTEGVTRCLVGTRHLLGEGWDCPAVCCVVDLTGITASVTVQQVRGRALRPDPADPSKIASLWDVVALAPGVPDGDRMLRRLRDRHRHTFGVDDQGRVVTGVARIDPRLAHDVTLVAAAAESLQATMQERLRDRDEVAERWAVGKDYRDARIWQVASPSSRTRPVLPVPRRPEPEVAAGPQAVVTRLAAESHALERRVGSLRVGTVLAGGTLGLVGGVLLSALGPLSVFASVGGTIEVLGGIFLSALGPLSLVSSFFGVAGGAVLGGLAGSGVRGRFRSQVDRDAAIAQALHAALLQTWPEIGTLHRTEDRLWTDGPDGGRRFAEAAATLLGPVRYPRYLLVEADGTAWPVPMELGARRDLADTLAAAWGAHVGPCSVVYARSEAGKALLRAAWKAGGHTRGSVAVVESWE